MNNPYCHIDPLTAHIAVGIAITAVALVAANFLMLSLCSYKGKL